MRAALSSNGTPRGYVAVAAGAELLLHRLRRGLEHRQQIDRREQQGDDARGRDGAEDARNVSPDGQQFEQTVQRAAEHDMKRRLRMSGQQEQRQNGHQDRRRANTRPVNAAARGEENEWEQRPRAAERPEDEKGHAAGVHPAGGGGERNRLAAAELPGEEERPQSRQKERHGRGEVMLGATGSRQAMSVERRIRRGLRRRRQLRSGKDERIPQPASVRARSRTAPTSATGSSAHTGPTACRCAAWPHRAARACRAAAR